ncbi:hypothetical protein QLQ12_35250 [Actinoplanes sp. NEAU-A12]|uniref:Integral membrane protein n=1 Tax=Actinoplanes sandaracinus TaxID=3045177 RepID=A0ABT6WVY4_9ACTN|nr:hypothetical protein [Actinoplanes sandaracinus]MDI6103885.1 hypothetical protein [Actinoplanes sandaracinus]
MSQNAVLIGVAAAVLSTLGLHMLMARKGPVWMGAIVPVLLVAAVVMLIVQGRLEPGRPYLVAAAALVMLLLMWANGRDAKRKTEAKASSGAIPRRS